MFFKKEMVGSINCYLSEKINTENLELGFGNMAFIGCLVMSRVSDRWAQRLSFRERVQLTC